MNGKLSHAFRVFNPDADWEESGTQISANPHRSKSRKDLVQISED